MPSFCQLSLTCANENEATKLAKALLDARLIACAKQIPVSSQFRWQGKIDKSNEVLLVMDSRVDLFEQIEKEVAKLHSYDTFVLQATPVINVSKDAAGWLKSELKNA